MKQELTDYQLEVDKAINVVLDHLGKHVVDRRLAGIAETYITGSVSNQDIMFWIYPNSSALQVGRRHQSFGFPEYEPMVDVVTHGYYRTKSGRRRRYGCRICRKTFSSTKSTAYFRFQYPRSTFDEVAVMSVEGVNKSAISRVKSPAWNTVHRWHERAGESCRNYSIKTLTGFEIKELQTDELCTFVGNKKKATWIFTAMEVWSRLWPATVVGRRSYWNTFELLGQVQKNPKETSAH